MAFQMGGHLFLRLHHKPQAGAQGAVVVCNVTADVTADAVSSTDGLLFVESVAKAGVETAEVGGVVRDQVVSADAVVVGALASCPVTEAHELADTGGAEQVVGGQLLEGRDLVTAQAHFTEVARQAHGGTTLEVEAAGVAIVTEDFAFQPEASLQTTTQVFRAAQAQTARGSAAGAQAVTAVASCVLVHVGNVGVHDTEQGHGGLSHCGAGSSQHCQGNQRFFHYELLQGLEGRRS